MLKHVYKVDGVVYSVPCAVAIKAYVLGHADHRVQAVKLIRAELGCGLWEATQLATFIRDMGTLDDEGLLTFRNTMVTYDGRYDCHRHDDHPY
jgi:hypothetical protein